MSSPWGTVAAVEAVDFQEIMSEEFARGLQEHEGISVPGQVPKQNVVKPQKPVVKVEDYEPVAGSSRAIDPGLLLIDDER